jgi:hypothetical protein
MKDREVACEYYVCQGECMKGRKADFYGYCQKCKLYTPIKNGRPARKDLRRQKREQNLRRDLKRMHEEY